MTDSDRRPRRRRLRLTTALAIVIALVIVSAYAIFQSIPDHRTAFLVDTSVSAPAGGEKHFGAIADAVGSAARNTAADEALSLRRFGGSCGDPQNTAEVVESGTGQGQEIADAARGFVQGGRATLLDGILAAVDDFSGYYPFRGRKSNRIIVLSTSGTDACHRDQATVENAIKQRITDTGLQIDFRFIGFNTPAREQGSLTKTAAAFGAPKPNFAQTADELKDAVLEQLKIPDSPEAAQVSTPGTSTPPTGEQVDIAFVIDTTGSMRDDIQAAQAAIGQITDNAFRSGRSTRVALVEYRDANEALPPEYPGYPEDVVITAFQAKVDVGLTDNRKEFTDAVSKLDVGGGGDFPESVFSGLMAAFELKWRPEAAKLVIPMGDAPAKDPEPVTGYTAAQIQETAKAGGKCIVNNISQPCKHPAPVVINPILIGSDPLAATSFTELAAGGRGEVINANDAQDVVKAIDDAVNKGVDRAKKAAPQPPPQQAPSGFWDRTPQGVKIAVIAVAGVGFLVGLLFAARSRRRTSSK